MIKVTTPATTANLGPGFDSMGMALQLYNTLYAEESDRMRIESASGQDIPTDDSNLIYKTMCGFYEMRGLKNACFHLIQDDHIPMTRGLGSSAACIVSGLVAANALLGSPCGRDDLLQLAAATEGHPDNAAPAMLGGIVTGAMDDGRLYYSRINSPNLSSLRFAVMIPDFPLSTEDARNILPEDYSRADVVYNVSRAALVAAALASGQYELLSVALKDRLHQPYRCKLIPGMEEIFASARESGALGVFLSGAGPTIIAVVPAAKTFAPSLPDGWQLTFLPPDENGAQVVEA
jgi:homoserine kinase